jgi:hypothetical protein
MRDLAQNNTMQASSVAGKINEDDIEDSKTVPECCEQPVGR